MENNEIINKIQREYDMLRFVAENKKNENVQKAYEKSPELKDIDEKINKAGLEMMRKIINSPSDAVKLRNELDKNLLKLKRQREEIMKKYKIEENYNKPVYQCDICSDTGYVNEGRCKCFEEKIIKENVKNSNLGNMICNEGFDGFSLEYYEENQRKIIGEAVESAKKLCEDFEGTDYNLFFYGTTGLGKTYLSTITANEILKKGKSVHYVRAAKMFSDYDDYKFKDYSLKEYINELYNCDLLVIDDLGSENTNKNDVAFFFDLVNERLINNKRMIINTNLEISEFTKIYSVRLTSRIYESFKIFRFEGEDIRIKRLIKKL